MDACSPFFFFLRNPRRMFNDEFVLLWAKGNPTSICVYEYDLLCLLRALMFRDLKSIKRFLMQTNQSKTFAYVQEFLGIGTYGYSFFIWLLKKESNSLKGIQRKPPKGLWKLAKKIFITLNFCLDTQKNRCSQYKCAFFVLHAVNFLLNFRYIRILTLPLSYFNILQFNYFKKCIVYCIFYLCCQFYWITSEIFTVFYMNMN